MARPDLRAQYEHAAAVREAAAPVAEGLSADVEFAGAEGETLEQTIARILATRKPLGAFTQKLAYAKRPGYQRHWFNDSPGRLEEARAAGWAAVAGTDRRPVTRHVGQGRDNLGQNAHLMELPEVIFQMDRDEYHKLAAGRVDAIKTRIAVAKPGEATAADKGKFYDPHQESGATPVQVVKNRR